MATNTVKARIQLKNDTEVNWSKSRFIPLKGEVIIYSTDDTHPFCRLKVGNGETNINDLPFVEGGGSGSGTPGVLAHSLIFGANGEYVFDGSKDVIVPVYTGTTT